ncbi:MAG: DEAD/DEAH box helicase [Bacilli bacterium]
MFIVNCKRDGKKDKFILSFQYEPSLISKLKEIHWEDRKFNPSNKTWTVKTFSLYNLMLQYKGNPNIFFKFDDDEKEYFKNKVKKKINEIKTLKERQEKLEEKKIYWLEYKKQLKETYKVHEDKLHQNLKEGVKLLPFQSQAVLYGDVVRNVLFALEMGTGKSIISIALSEYNNFNKVFVITPNSLKFNYFYEVEKFTNSKAHIINWKKNKYTLEESKYIIINYDFFRNNNSVKKFENLNLGKIDCLILDECHRIKNPKSNIYKNFKAIFTDDIFVNETPCKIFMSGTPMNNRAYELYTVMNQISPIDFPNKQIFYSEYCGMTYDPSQFGGYNFDSNATNFEGLYHKISPYVFRVRKMDVLKDLPSKTYERIILELTTSEEKEYNNILDGVIDELSNKETVTNPMTIMLRLRQYLSILKVNNKDLIEFIDMLLEMGEKIVIMDYFKEGIEILHEKYKDISVLHYGDVSVEDRSKMVKQFQDKDSNIKMFLSTVQTGKEGLTLTSSSKIMILTQPYTVSENEQVVDRVHRISQTEKVNVYYPLFNNTIDFKVFNLVEDKKKEIVKVLDNEDYKTKIDDSTINELVNSLKLINN